MLYVNRPIPVVTHKMRTGRVFAGFFLGMYMPRTHREFVIAPSTMVGQLLEGFNEKLTLRETRDGHFCIDDRADRDNLYMLLSSQLTGNFNRVGNIRVPRMQRAKILVWHKYVPKAPNNHVHWQTALIKAQPDEMFYVSWNHPTDPAQRQDMVYSVTEDLQVIAYPLQESMRVHRDSGAKTPPFTDYRNCTVQLDKSEWRKI